MFSLRRTRGFPTKPLRVLDPIGLYQENEEAFDVYGHPSMLSYLYKLYPEGGGYELASYGVESLYRHWKVLAGDPEAFMFVAKILREG